MTRSSLPSLFSLLLLSEEPQSLDELVLHTAPLKERVDTTYHWHWELHPRLREVAGLELGSGLPVQTGTVAPHS